MVTLKYFIFSCVFLLFQIFPTSTSHSKMVYSSSNLKTALKSGAGSKPHDVQEALKKKQVLNTLQQEISIFTFFIY